MKDLMLKMSTSILFMLACAGYGGALAKERQPIFPKSLHGVWEVGLTPCKMPGNLDSDTRIEIKPSIVEGYEHTTKPLSIFQVSKKPMAWKVKSAVDIDGLISDEYEIYILSGKDVLTVVDDNLPRVYSRCK